MPDPADEMAPDLTRQARIAHAGAQPSAARPSLGSSFAAPVQLTMREIEVLRWIATGKSDWQVGQILGISAKTVNYHVENVKRKYAVATRIKAVVLAVRQGKLPA